MLQGADTVIYERLVEGNHNMKKATREHLGQFGSSGLRTLCLAYRDLSSEFYGSWNEKFIQAKSSLREREKKLDEVSILSSHCLKLHAMAVPLSLIFAYIYILLLLRYMSKF